MNFRVISIFVYLFLTCSCGTTPSENNDPKTNKDSLVKIPVKIDSLRKSVIFPKEMYAPRKSAFDEYFIRVGDSSYYCGYKGKFEISDTLGSPRKFLFDLKAEYLIDKVFFHVLNHENYFVCWQATDHTGVSSYAALFKRGSNKPLWMHRFNAPNPGQIAVDSQYVFVSTLGSVGKMDIWSGEFVWKQDSLFDAMKYRFKEFDKPIVYTNTICFFDFPIRGRKAKRDTIWIDDRSGEIIK